MITAFEETVLSTLVPQRCGKCGILFGMEKHYRDSKVQEHGSFYCPNGHSRQFIGQTEAERLRAQLQRTERCLQFAREETQDVRKQRDTANNRLRGTKAVVTRMKRRLVAGRCVCCSKQFKDLETHMETRHPNWNPDKTAEVLAAK